MAAPISSVDRWYQVELHIEAEMCAHCGLCASLCPVNILVCDKRSVTQVTEKELCQRCYACETHCPTHALRFVRIAPSFMRSGQKPVYVPGKDKQPLQERGLQ